MITDPDYINQKLLVLIQKIQQDQKHQLDRRSLSGEGEIIGLSDTLRNEAESEEESVSSKPRMGRFDSTDSDTSGATSVTFKVGQL